MEVKTISKKFLSMIHNLLVAGVNFGNAGQSIRRADQIEDICKGYCGVIEEIILIAQKENCKWHKNGYHWEDHDYWETGCDNLFQFNVGGPEDNRFKFCPYCGKPIEEVKKVEEVEEIEE